MDPTDDEARVAGFASAADMAATEDVLREEHDIANWMEAGAPEPLAMWRMIQDLLPAAEAPGETPPALSEQTMAVLPLDLVRYYLGRISAEAFDANVRPHVKMRPIGSRRFVVTESLREYVNDGGYKSLA